MHVTYHLKITEYLSFVGNCDVHYKECKTFEYSENMICSMRLHQKQPPKRQKKPKKQKKPTNLCCFYILYYINKKIKRSKIFLLTNCTLKTYLFMLCPTVELYALRYFVESFQICYAISLYSQLVCYLYPVYYLFRICQA